MQGKGELAVADVGLAASEPLSQRGRRVAPPPSPPTLPLGGALPPRLDILQDEER